MFVGFGFVGVSVSDLECVVEVGSGFGLFGAGEVDVGEAVGVVWWTVVGAGAVVGVVEVVGVG